MIITGGYIKDMKITQELLKKSWICKSRYISIQASSIEVFWIFLNSSQYIVWYIEPIFSSFYLLNTCVDLLKSSSTNPSIPPNRPKSSCMHFIYFSCIAFFSLCVHSIWFSCFSCRSMIPCSPHSFYVSFQSVFGQVFFTFYVLWQLCQKRGRNLRFECHSSGEVIDLGGEFHVKGKKIFDVTNIGGKLVWYTLILIYFEMCIFLLYTHAMIEIFLLFILLALWKKKKFYWAYLINLSVFPTWYLDTSCLVSF